MRMTQARKTAVYRVITDSGGIGSGLHDTFRPVSRGPGTKTRRTTNSFYEGGRKNMRKRMTSLLLTLVMLLSLVPAVGVTASAADDTSYTQAEIRNYKSFESYLRSSDSRDLKLMEDKIGRAHV